MSKGGNETALVRSASDLSREVIEAALAKTNGAVRPAARKLRVSRETLRLRIQSDPALVEFRRNQFVDLAESRMADLADDSRETVKYRAAAFILTHLGAAHGWRKTKDRSINAAELKVIDTAIEALIKRFVPHADQDLARNFFRQKMIDEHRSQQGLPPEGFTRTAPPA